MELSTSIVETERLILREILFSDAHGMFELDGDPMVHQFLGNKPLKNKEQVEQVIQSIRNQYVENGIGRWAIIEKSTNNFIGWTGLKLVKEVVNNHNNYYDLGYRLIRKYWGQGFATESAIASVNYAFNHLNLDTIYAAANTSNEASNKILQKIGFESGGVFEYDNALHNWYELENAVWQRLK